jgi:hypothetical protein
MLKDIRLEPVYDSAEYDIVRSFMTPCLAASTKYVCGVGSFSSGWLGLAASGVIGLVENGGKAIFVVSPILSREDWESMQPPLTRFPPQVGMARLLGRLATPIP